MTSSYQKISGFDRPHVSEMLSDSKISTLESGLKNFRICLRIRRMRVDDSRIRKEKVADSKISGYVWTGPKRPSVFPALQSYSFWLSLFTPRKHFPVVQDHSQIFFAPLLILGPCCLCGPSFPCPRPFEKHFIPKFCLRPVLCSRRFLGFLATASCFSTVMNGAHITYRLLKWFSPLFLC